MKSVKLPEALRLVTRGTINFITGKPLAVSFEVTHSCTGGCKHCDKGGIKKETNLMQPEDYRRYQSALKPMVVQMSGGEPLLRKDIFEIARAIKKPNGLPYLILVTNAKLLTVEKYQALREAGVNQFSISLDFSNSLHDDFRGSPGLYAHLESLVPELASLGNDDIVLNTAITSDNLPYILDNYQTACQWGVDISYSAYTPLRTGSMEHFISSPEELEELRSSIIELIRLKKNGRVLNYEWTLWGTYRYFKNGTVPGCKAGRRFLVVTPDGQFQPCSMHKRTYPTREEMLRAFLPTNTCGECYVAIRAYLDHSFWKMLWSNISSRVLARGKDEKPLC